MEEVFYLSKNLRYLRSGVGLGISELADLGHDLDPLDVYDFEKNTIAHPEDEKMLAIVSLADYFAVRLGDLFYEEVEEKKIVTAAFFEELKMEYQAGIRANRKVFNDEVINNETVRQDGESERNYVLKKLLNTYHLANHAKRLYRNRRAKGLADKSDFFEDQNNPTLD